MTLSLFRNIKTTTTNTGTIVSLWMQLLFLNIFITHSTTTRFGIVDAQSLYVNCTTSGLSLTSCYVNKTNPLTYTATDGTFITLGNFSRLAIRCVTNSTRSIDTCECAILVDPDSKNDICNSCTLTTINDTTIENYFDCSNRLMMGPCVGLTVTGECISSTTTTTTTFVPTPVPVPFIVPPILPSTDNAGSTGSQNNNTTVGIVIVAGIVGGIVLSVLVVYFISSTRRKQQRHATPKKSQNNPNVDVSIDPTLDREYSSRSNNGDNSHNNDSSLSRLPPKTMIHNNIIPNTNKTTQPLYDNIVPPPLVSSSSPSPQRKTPSYPLNPNLHVKDQCRMVRPVVTISSPAFMIPKNTITTTATIPFAVAVGVSTVISSSSSQTTNVSSTMESSKGNDKNNRKNKNSNARDRILLEA